MDRKLLIIIATFNEKENLPLLVEQLRNQIQDVRILVVDDSSPDGTGVWATEQAAKYPDIFAIVRERERGLGGAAIAGFRWGLEQGFEFLATMDADFSHNPNAVLDLLERLREKEDLGLVIGSRYVSGGRIEGWPLRRRIVSRLVNGFAKIWLGLRTRDNTGAFRIYRSSALASIDLNRIRSSGYGYLEEILFRLQQKKVKMAEVPILFRDRRAGHSKTSLTEGVRVLVQIFLLRVKRQ